MEEVRRVLFVLYKNGRIDASDVTSFARDVDELKAVKGIDGPIKDIERSGGDWGNYKGAAFEIEDAATLQRQGITVKEIGRSAHPPRGETDIDVVTVNDNLIEAKSGNFKGSESGKVRYESLEEKLKRYEQYRNNHNLGDIEVHFKSDPHPDIVELINNYSGKCKVLDGGAFRNC